MRKIIPFLLTGAMLLSTLPAANVYAEDITLPGASGSNGAAYQEGCLHFLNPGFTDAAVKDEAGAIKAAAEAGQALGFRNALSELEGFCTTAVDGEVYYRLQQMYNGLPVYGRYVTVVASDSGKALGLSTDVKDIPENLTLTPSVTEKAVRDAVTDFALLEWGSASENMEISSLSPENLVIYDRDEERGACLAYLLSVENEGTREVLIDARTAEVLEAVPLAFSGRGTNADGSLEAPVETYSGSTYYVYDQKRGIEVYHLNGGNSRDAQADQSASNVFSNGDTVFGNTPEEKNQDPDTAFRLVNSIGEIRDWYLDLLEEENYYDTIKIYYNDSWDEGRNAYASKTFLNREARFYIGSDYKGDEKTILAHEFAHTIQFLHNVAIGGSLQSDTIAEGLADTFAWFCTGDPNFIMQNWHRNAENPKQYGFPESINDELKCPKKYEYKDWYAHAYATVISHAAFLMSETGLFSEQELQALWYKTMISLPYDCSYQDLKSSMQHTAVVSGYSVRQNDAIAKIFDEVGINADMTQEYGNDILLTVCDKEQNDYEDYTVEIFKKGTKESDRTHLQDVKGTSKNGSDPLKLHLENGTYSITIKDNADFAAAKSVSYTILVSASNRRKNMTVYDFGADYTVAPNAKFTFLDADGNALTDYMANLFGGSSSTAVLKNGVIVLPEKNCYQIWLTRKVKDVIYWEVFSLRIKKGGADNFTFRSKYGSSDNVQTGAGIASDIEQKLQGLWITSSSQGTLYKFENGTADIYRRADPGAPYGDRHYVKETPQSYTIEELRPAEGSGYKIKMENGIEYWLIDGYPDALECHWYENGQLGYSGSGSLMRVKDFTEEDLILSGDDASAQTGAFPYKMDDLSVGSLISFGSYEQDGSTANGKEPINWIVLDKKEDCVLVTSDYILDCQPFHSTEANAYWADSTLRTWLNDTFLKTAFTDAERSFIQTASVTTDTEGETLTSFVGEPLDYHTETQDKVFLLSKTEAETYFTSNAAKTCKPTAYARSLGADDCNWWTRSLDGSQRTAAVVMSDGSVNSGDGVANGTNVGNMEGVRPALWIKPNP